MDNDEYNVTNIIEEKMNYETTKFRKRSINFSRN